MPMLSLKSSNSSNAIKFRKAKPNRLGGKLVGWWDFTDTSTLFKTVGGVNATAATDPKCSWSMPERVSVFESSQNGMPIQARAIHFHIIVHTS